MNHYTHLLLHECQLLQVALQESHLLLLSLRVAIPDDIVVLFFDLIQLDLELNDLQVRGANHSLVRQWNTDRNKSPDD